MRYFIFLWLLSVCSCTERKEGIKFVFECTLSSKDTFQILERDIEKIDWDAQFFYLKDGTIDEKDFNTKVCYEGCYLSVILDNEILYTAALHCSIAPVGLDTKKGNVLFINPKKRELSLYHKGRLQLNINSGRLLSNDEKRQNKLISFMYNKKLKKYLVMNSEANPEFSFKGTGGTEMTNGQVEKFTKDVEEKTE